MADREKVVEHLYDCVAASNPGALWVFARKVIVGDAIALLKGQPEVVRCKDCKWYDERISLCDNCGLPREQTFFCADGKRR